MQSHNDGVRIQKATVRNKTQLIAALTMAINCPVDTLITLKHKRTDDTTMLIYGTGQKAVINPYDMYRHRDSSTDDVMRQRDLPLGTWNGPIEMETRTVIMAPITRHAARIAGMIQRVRRIPAKELFNN